MHGSITYMVNYYTEHIWDIDVDKYNFIPSPKVDSKVIGLKFRKEPYPKIIDEKLYFDIIKTAFTHRRKTFLNSISSLKNIDKDKIISIMKELDIDLRIRAEKITDDMYAKIVNMYKREVMKKRKGMTLVSLIAYVVAFSIIVRTYNSYNIYSNSR